MAKRTRIRPAHGNPAFSLRPAPRTARAKDSGTLVIRFEPAAVASMTLRRGARRASALAELPGAVGEPLRWLKDNYGLRDVQPLFPGAASGRALRAARGGARTALALHASVHDAPVDALRGYSIACLDPKRVDAKLVRHLSQAPGVRFVERVPRRWLSGRTKPQRTDPQRNNQWGLRAIGWFEQKLPLRSDVEVAILDSGVDRSHRDLKSIVTAYDHGECSADDLIGHGTHVAGIVAAMANNGVGISGVAPCRLRVWKVFADEPSDDGELYTDDAAYLRALGEAAAAPVRVINLSLGGFDASRAERELIKILIAHGKVVVAAMGNEYEEGNPPEYPAAYGNVIAVGAVTITMQRASFSNTGRHISLMAPGKHILSTLPMKRSAFRAPDEVGYAYWDGTSMAAPCVAGCIALAMARQPALDAATLMAALPKVTRKLPAMKKKFSSEYGYGLIHIPSLFKFADGL